ncbi:MAG: hypothetical protein ACO1O1_14355 [Adhaeribacter sp.]
MKQSKPILLLWIQGLYFLLPSVWPLVHMPSFLAVTGPKVDLWLVRTVALLLIAMSLTFLTAAWRREYISALGVLAVSSACGLAFIDFYYALQDRIWDTYLIDGVGELALILAWVVYFFKSRKG